VSALRITLEIASVAELEALRDALELYIECEGARQDDEPSKDPYKRKQEIANMTGAERLLGAL
jgi:hypothetical protein